MLGFWEGGETRLGKTDRQAVDATVFSVLSAGIMKRIFTRQRPSETDDPNKFFQGGSRASFPSGEVAAMSAIVTPFVLEYRHENPGVYALELLPLYDAVARVKARGHWQSDVLVGFGVGTLAGYYAHNREQPFFPRVAPAWSCHRSAQALVAWPGHRLRLRAVESRNKMLAGGCYRTAAVMSWRYRTSDSRRFSSFLTTV